MPHRTLAGSAVLRFQLVADIARSAFGPWAGYTIAALIVWTAFASIFSLQLGYSRVPYAAARDGNYFRFLGARASEARHSSPLACGARRRGSLLLLLLAYPGHHPAGHHAHPAAILPAAIRRHLSAHAEARSPAPLPHAALPAAAALRHGRLWFSPHLPRPRGERARRRRRHRGLRNAFFISSARIACDSGRSRGQRRNPAFWVRTSFHSSGKSTPHCRFRHNRRTTSSLAFPLALGWNGSTDTARPGRAARSHATVEDFGVEDSGVVHTGAMPRAQAGLERQVVARKRRKSWTGGLSLLHNARSRQSKVQSRRSPQCKPDFEGPHVSPLCAQLYPRAGGFAPIQILSIVRTCDVHLRNRSAQIL